MEFEIHSNQASTLCINRKNIDIDKKIIMTRHVSVHESLANNPVLIYHVIDAYSTVTFMHLYSFE